MIKRLVFSLIFLLFLSAQSFASYFEFIEPGFEEKMFKEEVENGGSILTNINTVALDSWGNIFYLKSNRDSILSEKESFTWEEMEQTEYSVTLAKISTDGTETVLGQGKFPLKTNIVGMVYDRGVRRLLIFLKTLAISEGCPFFSSATLSMKALESSSSSIEGAGQKSWNWSGLENCFFEKLSILEITGPALLASLG